MINFNDGHTFWDQTIIDELLKDLPESDRKIVIIPGALQAEKVDEISMELEQYPKVLVIITSDEESLFPIDQLYHPDMKIYVMYPNKDKHQRADYFLPIGPAPDYKMIERKTKDIEWFFAGQITHPARQEMAEVLKEYGDGVLKATDGFAKGYPHKDYYDTMSAAKIVPSPGGPCSPDSFRLYEALEAGAIPIPDNPEFWTMLYGEIPFPTVENWSQFPDKSNHFKDRFDVTLDCMAWWMRKKWDIREQLMKDLNVTDDITVLVSMSPIPSHPATDIVDEVIGSVRHFLPKAKIILMFDGVREEQGDRKSAYQEYIYNMLWKYKDCYPMIFKEHSHQATMTKEALRYVSSPYILFMEQDTPLTADREIPFDRLLGELKSERANIVRLMHEANILEPHEHLMFDKGEFTKTVQWSQRPHLANADYYRHILDTYFSAGANSFIEDRMYGVVEQAWNERGRPGWNEHKIVIWAPEGDMKRSYHTDGRAGGAKWDDRQVF